MMGIFRDVTEKKKVECELFTQKETLGKTNKELEAKVHELESAAKHIKKLEGLVPICACCKKMLSEGGDPKDPGSWISFEK